MPNNIDITLSVMGKDRDLRAFTQQAQGQRKPTGDVPTLPNGLENFNYDMVAHPSDSVFEFDRLIPLPESYSQFPYSSHGYNLEVATWGIKWGAFGHKPPKFEEGSATYQFRCAGEAPRVFLEKVSSKWPDLWFVVSYGGEGLIRGKFALYNGEYLENNAENGSSLDEDMPDEEYDAWVDVYRDAHEAYTKIILFTHIWNEIYRDNVEVQV